MTRRVVLGTPFLTLVYPIQAQQVGFGSENFRSI
jgi:hypothetical protein